MKKLLLFLSPILLWCTCEDDTPIMPAPPMIVINCEDIDCPTTDEFFGKCIMNGECWTADWVFFTMSGSGNGYILMRHRFVDGIIDDFYFNFNQNTNWQDTIWLGFTPSDNPSPHIVSTNYSYTEGHSIAGSFYFPFGEPLTGEDFLLIDYFNEDTTIVEGRFQVKFPERVVNSYVTHAPDSMQMRCGSFRVMRE